MNASWIRSLLLTCLLASGVVACAARDESAPQETVLDRSLAEQLTAQQFELDPARAPRRLEGTEITYYRHVDGRAAALVRESGAGTERAAIFDPATNTLLATIEAPARKATSGALRPADTGCSYTTSEWGPGYLTVIFTTYSCDGSSGTACGVSIFWMTGNIARSTCEETSCACVSGDEPAEISN